MTLLLAACGSGGNCGGSPATSGTPTTPDAETTSNAKELKRLLEQLAGTSGAPGGRATLSFGTDARPAR